MDMVAFFDSRCTVTMTYKDLRSEESVTENAIMSVIFQSVNPVILCDFVRHFQVAHFESSPWHGRRWRSRSPQSCFH